MKREICIALPPQWKGNQSCICHLLAACLAQVECLSTTSLDVRGKDTRFDFWAPLGTGKSWRLNGMSQNFVNRRMESLTKYRKSSKHKDQAP